MIVTIQLIDGTCKTLSSTLELLKNLPHHENNIIKWGRTKACFSEVLKYVRGESDGLIDTDFFEDFKLVGLSNKEEELIDRAVHVNIGGTVFTAREAVLRTCKYFDSSIRFSYEKWLDNSNTICPNTVDMSDAYFFIDRSPDEFASFLKFLETHKEGDGKVPNRAQAEFFGYEFDFDVPIVDDYKNIKNYDRSKIGIASPHSNDSPGALLGLVAVGSQNIWINGKTNVTSHSLFNNKAKDDATRVCHHTFAYNSLFMNTKKITPDMYNIVFESKCDHIGNMNMYTYTYCDHIGNMYMYVDLCDEVELTQDLVFDMVKSITLKIGNQVIDSYSGDAMRVFANGANKIEIYGSRVVIPLDFYFQNTPHLFIPLVALTQSPVSIELLLKNGTFSKQIKHIALNYKAIFLDTDERRYVAKILLERNIYITQEKSFMDIVVDDTNIATLDIDEFHHIIKDLLIYLKPKGFSSEEPLQKITLHGHGREIISIDHIMSRKIIPRESYGIPDNKELIYYIPINQSLNFSRMDHKKIKLINIVSGTYDIVVITKHHNVLRVMNGQCALAYTI